MFEQIKRLVRHSAIYGIGGFVSRILAVLLLPLYTRYLSPSDYGAIATLVRQPGWADFLAQSVRTQARETAKLAEAVAAPSPPPDTAALHV